jgi:HemY protein
MRWLFWILGLFACAVAFALALRFNTGYALLVWPPYRAELSLNLVLLLLIAGFAVVYLLLRFIFGAIGLPAKVREFRERRRRENARSMMLAALQAFFEGRYGRAEKAAANAIESGGSPALGAVLAAHAAHELRHYEQRDRYLARAEKLAPDDGAMRIIASAEMLLDERRFQDALLALKALPEKHTAALRLELKALQQAKNWEQTLPLIDQLERRGVFDALQAGELRRYAHAENLTRAKVRMISDGYIQKGLDVHRVVFQSLVMTKKRPPRMERDSLAGNISIISFPKRGAKVFPHSPGLSSG